VCATVRLRDFIHSESTLASVARVIGVLFDLQLNSALTFILEFQELVAGVCLLFLKLVQSEFRLKIWRKMLFPSIF
jgi:hypothetical protein